MHAHRRVCLQRIVSTLSCVMAAACGGDGPTRPGAVPGLHVVAGGGLTDSIYAVSPQALVVEVRRANGKVAAGVEVLFQAQPHADSSRGSFAGMAVCTIVLAHCIYSSEPGTNNATQTVDSTDSNGRARATVQNGFIAGRGVIRILVPALGLTDSATYTVTRGAAFRLRVSSSDTAAIIGTTVQLRAAVEDRAGNARDDAILWRISGSSSSISVDASGGRVDGRAFGTGVVLASAGTFSDSAVIRVVPRARFLVWAPASKVVRLIDSDGAAPRDVLNGIATQLGVFPRFDPSRGQITAFGSGSFIGPTTLEQTDTLGTSRHPIADGRGFALIIAARLLADGTLLMVARKQNEADKALWRVDANGVASRLVTLPGLEYGSIYGGADISPDGSRVAYVYVSPFAGTSELRVVNVSTGAANTVAPLARTPRWSPDGSRLAYLLPAIPFYEELNGVAMVVNADGTDRRALGAPVFLPGITWSPDGAYILGGLRDEPNGPAMRMVRVSDGADVQLKFRTRTGELQRYYQPDWR